MHYSDQTIEVYSYSIAIDVKKQMYSYTYYLYSSPVCIAIYNVMARFITL